jgi:hypothetical protein
MWQNTEHHVPTLTGTTQLWCAPTNKHLSSWCLEIWVASVHEYQGRSVKQGHDDRGTSALQLPSGEAVRRVAPTQAVAFSKLQLMIGSAVRSAEIIDVFCFDCKVACQQSCLKNRTSVDADIFLTGNELRNEIMEVKCGFLNHSVYWWMGGNKNDLERIWRAVAVAWCNVLSQPFVYELR